MIGKKLESLLEQKDMKPGTLARLADVPKSTIYSIINRNNKSVDFSVMERICDVLEVPVEYFHDKPVSSILRNESNKDPALISWKDLEELRDVFHRLSPGNRSLLLKIAHIFLTAQTQDAKKPPPAN